MRLITVMTAVSLLLVLPAMPAFACGAGVQATTTTNLLAAKKKMTKKKTAKKKKEKVEYMRAVPAK